MRTQNIFIILVASFGICFAVQALPVIGGNGLCSAGVLYQEDFGPVAERFSVLRAGCLELYHVVHDERRTDHLAVVRYDSPPSSHIFGRRVAALMARVWRLMGQESHHDDQR